MKVKLLEKNAICPTKDDDSEVGYDLSTFQNIKLAPGERKLVSLGFALELPKGMYGRVASRTELALQGVDVGGGVVDPDYRGELRVILHNRAKHDIKLEAGEKIAQLIIGKEAEVKVKVTSTLSKKPKTSTGGVGSAGPASYGGIRLCALRAPSGVKKRPATAAGVEGSEQEPKEPRVEGEAAEETAGEPSIGEGGGESGGGTAVDPPQEGEVTSTGGGSAVEESRAVEPPEEVAVPKSGSVVPGEAQPTGEEREVEFEGSREEPPRINVIIRDVGVLVKYPHDGKSMCSLMRSSFGGGFILS